MQSLPSGSAMDSPCGDSQFIEQFTALQWQLCLHMMKRKYIVISQSDPLTEPPPMAVEEAGRPSVPSPEIDEDYDYDDQLAPQQPDWLTRLVLLPGDLVYSCMSLILSPVSSLFHLATDSYRHAEEAKDIVGSAVQKVPSNISHGGVLLVRKLGMGFLGMAYVCMVLIAVMAVSVVLGVGMVRMWVEEPVHVRERLHFDYTELHPNAVVPLCGSGRGSGRFVLRKPRHAGGVPVGHTFQVSLSLLMPDSDYNRQIGVFQLTAELLTGTGQVIAKSSQPCMMRFRSFPIRLARVFLFGVPLLLGISAETQKVKVEMLRYKEASIPRTDAIRVSLIPRAGTFSPPQLYEAEIIVNSQLPWPKKLVHNWKWSFYVWASLYTYTMLLLVMLCCFRPLVLSVPAGNSREQCLEAEEVPTSIDEVREQRIRRSGGIGDQERDVSELLRKLRESRSRRKALVMATEAAGSSASSMSMTREETTTTATSGFPEDDIGDSESVC